MLWSFCGIFSCYTRSSAKDADDLLLSRPGRLPNCIFCDVSKEKGFDVVWQVRPPSNGQQSPLLKSSMRLQDDNFIVFNDYRPAASHHLLVIPRKHIGQSNALFVWFQKPKFITLCV